LRVILLVATAPLSRFAVALVIGADGEDLHVPERGPQPPKGRELGPTTGRSRPAWPPPTRSARRRRTELGRTVALLGWPSFQLSPSCTRG
jgi:hypothetical protein